MLYRYTPSFREIVTRFPAKFHTTFVRTNACNSPIRKSRDGKEKFSLTHTCGGNHSADGPPCLTFPSKVWCVCFGDMHSTPTSLSGKHQIPGPTHNLLRQYDLESHCKRDWRASINFLHFSREQPKAWSSFPTLVGSRIVPRLEVPARGIRPSRLAKTIVKNRAVARWRRRRHPRTIGHQES